jgi:large repetitive protein
MPSKSHTSSSWFSRLGSVFAPRRRKAARNSSRRGLRFETLETRSLLSATVLPSISGIVYQDLAGGPLAAGDARVSNATINLFRDGGNGVFDGKSAGDDAVIGSTTSDTNGAYHFTNLTAGTYFVQEVAVPGLIVPAGTGVQKVVITDADLQGSAARTIDTFATTSQYVSGSYHGSKFGSSTVSTSDAIGGHRNLFVQLTSSRGSVSLGANSDFPGMLDFASGSASNGIFWVNWDGSNTDASMLNPTGLGQMDITSQGTATGISLSLAADHDNGFVTLKVYSDATNWSWATIPLQNTGDGSLGDSTYVAFSSFSVGGGTGANFCKVGAIQLAINGANANDGQIGPIQTIGPTVLTANMANIPQADLSVVKSAQPNPVIAGNQLTYTFTVTNSGPVNATGVTLTDALPAGETYVSANSSQGWVTNNNGTLTVLVGNLAYGATATTTVVVTVASSVTGNISNTATVTGDQADPNLINNTSTVTTTVTAPVINNATTDLRIVKTATPNPVRVGGTLTYTLTVNNNSLTTATNVTVIDTLPTGFNYVSASGQVSMSRSGNRITLNLGTLAANGTDTITIVGTVTANAASTITNTAVVSANETDIDPSNNTSSVITTVVRGGLPSKYWYIV